MAGWDVIFNKLRVGVSVSMSNGENMKRARVKLDPSSIQLQHQSLFPSRKSRYGSVPKALPRSTLLDQNQLDRFLAVHSR